MASGRARAKRWHIYTTRSVFVLTDNPEWDAGKRSNSEVVFLAISRDTGVARQAVESPEGFQSKLQALAGSGAKLHPQACDAVIGCLAYEPPADPLMSGSGGKGGVASQAAFLLIATEAASVARIGGRRIQELRRCEALPFSGAAETPSNDASAAVAGVKQLLEHHFYFSNEFDITRRLQCRAQVNSAAVPDDQMKLADQRFVWNRRLAEPLMQQEGVSARWFTPVMQGFCQTKEVRLARGAAAAAAPVLHLIARRSCRNQGTRFSARGIDDEGEAANWVETEQILSLPAEGTELSFVQVRGSAPVFWEQPSDTSKVTLTRGPELAAVGFERHWRQVEQDYGKVLFVNLLSAAAQKQSTKVS